MSNNINLSSFEHSTDVDQCTESEFAEKYINKGFSVMSEGELNTFISGVNTLIKKGETGSLSIDEFDTIEKAKRDITKLVRKQVTDKTGKVTTKWVKMSSDKKIEVITPDNVVEKHSEYMKKFAKDTGRAMTAGEAAASFSAMNQSAQSNKKIQHTKVFKNHPPSDFKVGAEFESTEGVHYRVTKTDNITHSIYFEKTNTSGKKDGVVMTMDGVNSLVVNKLKSGNEDKVEPKTVISHDEAWTRHQHNMKVQRQGKEASLKHIETKYGKDVADKVRERHEAPVKAAEKKSDGIEKPKELSVDDHMKTPEYKLAYEQSLNMARKRTSAEARANAHAKGLEASRKIHGNTIK